MNKFENPIMYIMFEGDTKKEKKVLNSGKKI